MHNPKVILFAVAVACIALLGGGLYLQIVKEMAPCPLCILQRYAFAATALICLLFVLLPRGSARTGAAFGAVAALTGAGLAIWHLWVKAHPAVSCGIDPMETSLNKLPTAEWLPVLFKADGFCTTEYAPILGLSIPQWALAWFILFAIVLGTVALRRSR